MADPESPEGSIRLREENEQIRAKYKKSLQELMHILKVNKSLKECLDQHSQQLASAVQVQVAEAKKTQQQELQAYAQQLEEYKRLYQQEADQRKQAQALIREMKTDLSSIHEKPQREAQGERAQGQERWKVGECLQLTKEKQQLRQENEQLKEKVAKLNVELMHEKEKARSELFSRDTELLRHKESQSERLKTIQSKYQLLQSELNNYKNVQRYFQDQANVLLDQQSVYNSIREQITRINEDFSKYELESSNLLLRKREEDAQRNRRIGELEAEVERLKALEGRAAVMEREKEEYRGEIGVLKEKMRQLQQEKKEINEKVMVLEALTLTEKHRVQPGVAERIKQFETRVGLLLDEVPRDSKTSSAQIVVLKGYVQQLSDLLRQAKKKQQKLVKKLQHYKQKINNAQVQFREKLGEYQGRIRSYDTLVGKLYAALEDRTKERGPEELERQFNTAIGHYEGKMLQMSEEILRLRTRAQELENSKEEHNGLSATLEAENQTYKEIISSLSIRVNELQGEERRVCELEQQLKEKNKVVDALAKEVNELTKKVEQQEKITINLSRQSIDAASLIEKVNYLEFQLARAKPEAVRGLEGTISAQQRQLSEYKQEVDRLYEQLRSEKTERKSSVADQYSLAAELQQRIAEGEIRELTLQNQWHNKEAEYRNELEALRLLNKTLTDQLAGREELQHQAQRVAELQRCIADLDRRNQQLVERFSSQASELNANLLALRTSNLSLRNELQTRQDAINELKHQLFNAELRSQKERSLHGSMIRSGSGSVARDSIKEDKEKEERLLTVVLLGVEVEALRERNGELEAMYHLELSRYREALKQLEARQLELCHSLQFSNEGELREQPTQPAPAISSQAELLPLSQSSTLIVENKVLQNTVRSQAWAGDATSASKVGSSVSIMQSPSRRRVISVKKIV